MDANKVVSGANKFAVVKFLSEDLVEAVSFSWVIDNGTKCYWPDSTLNYKNLVKKHQSPTLKWSIHACVILGVFVDYKAARLGARRAEDASDLNSTEPENRCVLQARNLRKRKYLNKPTEVKSKFQPHESSSSDDSASEEDHFPTPKLGLVRVPKVIVSSGCLESEIATTAATPLDQTSDIISKSQYPSFSLNSCSPVFPDIQPVNISSSIDIQQVNSSQSSHSGINNIDWNLVWTEITKVKSQAAKFQDEVLKRLIKIDNDNEELLRRTADKNLDDKDVLGLPNLPVTTVEEFSDLNEILKDESLRKKLIKNLRTIGGTNYSSVTQRILNTLVTNDLAKRLSLTGNGRKTDAGFKGTEILKSIYCSVQQTKKCAGVTESEIDKSIQNWLKNSGDRLGGRDARRKRAQPCVNQDTPEVPSADTAD